MKKILILSYFADLHDDALVRVLKSRSIDHFRCAFMEAKGRSFECCISGGRWEIEADGNVFNSENVSKIWIRSLAPVHLHDNDPHQYIANIESANAFNEFLCSLPQNIFFTKPIEAMRAKSKARQAVIASKIGLKIPSTSVFFTTKVKRKVSPQVLKSTIGGAWTKGGKSKYAVPTTRVSDLIDRPSNVFGLLQEEIQAEADIRLFLLGRSITAIRIWSKDQREKSPDYRFHSATTLRAEVFELPINLIEKLVELSRQLEVEVSAIDLLQGMDGEFYFLEANVMGNWIWYENLSGSKITQKIADFIAENSYP